MTERKLQMSKTRVMIVEDQFTARQLFEMYINSSEKYEIACMVESAAYADTFAASEHIDLVIMDILMNDGSNGFAAAMKVKKLCPGIRIIAVTSMAEASWLKKAKEIGIDSFWYKETSKETILEIMDRTMSGENVYPDSTPRVKLGLAYSTEFTERELEVLRVMTKGFSNSNIAHKLHISESTVKNHIHNMLEKTGCGSRTELAIEARISGVAVSIE